MVRKIFMIRNPIKKVYFGSHKLEQLDYRQLDP